MSQLLYAKKNTRKFYLKMLNLNLPEKFIPQFPPSPLLLIFRRPHVAHLDDLNANHFLSNPCVCTGIINPYMFHRNITHKSNHLLLHLLVINV